MVITGPAPGNLRLGLNLGRWDSPGDSTETVLVAERLGYDCVWTSEAFGSDALTPLAWYGARTTAIRLGGLLQIGARTPAAVAMAAMTLDRLSEGRLSLGFGVSGPQVIEGWYGADFSHPLARTREYVDLVRRMLRRDGPVEADGPHYPLPFPGGTGLGKPTLLSVRPIRAQVPIYLAASGPANVALATQIGSGWLPMLFHPERTGQVHKQAITSAAQGFDIAALVPVYITADIDAALRKVKTLISLYVGGFGARNSNFHLDALSRLGYRDEARHVRDLYLAGDRSKAAEAVPAELADAVALVGPIGRIRERLDLWRKSPVTTLLVSGVSHEQELRAIRGAVIG